MPKFLLVVAMLSLTGCATLRMKHEAPLPKQAAIYKVSEKPQWWKFWAQGPWVFGPYSLQVVDIDSMNMGISAPAKKGLTVGMERRMQVFKYQMVTKGMSLDSQCTMTQFIVSAALSNGIGSRNNKAEVSCNFHNGKMSWQMTLKGSPEDFSGELQQSGQRIQVRTSHTATDGHVYRTLPLGWEFVEKKPIAAADTNGEPDFLVLKSLNNGKKAALAAASGFFFLFHRYGDRY